MTKHTVQHYVTVAPDQHVVTRARVVACDAADDVTFFMRDKVIGVLCVPHGLGSHLCTQMGLVERSNLLSYQDIEREFKRALSAAE